MRDQLVIVGILEQRGVLMALLKPPVLNGFDRATILEAS